MNVPLSCKSHPLQPSGPLDPEPRGCCPLCPSHPGPLNPARVSEELPVIPWGHPMEPSTPAQLGAGDLVGWGGHFGGSPARTHSANQQTAASPSPRGGCGEAGVALQCPPAEYFPKFRDPQPNLLGVGSSLPHQGSHGPPNPAPRQRPAFLHTPGLTPLCTKVPSAKMKISSWPHFCGDSGNVHDVALPTPLTL